MRVSFKTLTAAALALGSAAVLQPAPASAQPWGYYHRGYGPPAFAARPFYGPRFYGGYRPAFYGPRSYGYPYGYYRRPNYGGAVAAGLIGGLALGTIASAAASPYYYRPAYYYPPAATCFTERRRIIDPFGRVAIQRVQTCY